MTLDLSHLLEVAEGATPGSWTRLHDGEERPRKATLGGFDVTFTKHPCECGQVWSDGADWPVAYCDTTEMGEGPSPDQRMANALHIATFDPPTVLALLDRLREAEGALRPFAKIGPSCFYPEDGSEAEVYTAVLWDGVALQDFTGADIARARAYFTPQPPSLPGRGEEP